MNENFTVGQHLYSPKNEGINLCKVTTYAILHRLFEEMNPKLPRR